VETDAADRWINERLLASAPLLALVGGVGNPRIFPDVAPEGTVPPWVVYSVASPRPDRLALGSVRIMVRPLYLVKAYAETTSWRGDLKALDEAIDAALNLGTPGPVADEGYLIGCRRTEAFRQIEREAGTEFRARGGFYELWVSEL
jgi:hypothetical protein